MTTAPDLLANLHLLRPHWLWALLALPLLGAWWHARRQRAQAWRANVDAHLLPHLLERNAGRRGRLGLVAGLAGYALAVVALAGPSWRQSEAPLWQTRAPLVVALDLSSAITATDLPPSRLLQARAKLEALLKARTGGQVGLVVFSGDAFTVAPLTDDARNVALFLDALDPSVMPIDGHRVDRAITHAAGLLAQAGFDQGDILLMAGSADARARDAAADAASRGYRVSALGLGTASGSAIRTALGAIEQVRLDAGALRALAAAGGGDYVGIASDLSDLRALGVLEPREAGDLAGGQGGRQWQDQGYWLLPPLMLLALLAFRRGGAALVVLCLALPLVPERAAAATPANASPAPAAGGWWLRPDQQRHRRMQRGIAQYRAGDHAAAAEAFAGVDTPDGHYNRGNALAKAGRYRDAIAAYDAALARQPGMPDAVANRAAVQALLEREPPPGANDSERGEPGEGQGGDAGQPADGGEPGQAGGSPDNAKSSPRTPPPSDDPGDARPQPGQGQAPPDDPADQAAADAAQRERMREALERAREQAGDDGERAEPADETPAERERRLANEAWLRRVPDDPGGLLRRRFALEHERRMRAGETP